MDLMEEGCEAEKWGTVINSVDPLSDTLMNCLMSSVGNNTKCFWPLCYNARSFPHVHLM
jgi:hypothetical protein